MRWPNVIRLCSWGLAIMDRFEARIARSWRPFQSPNRIEMLIDSHLSKDITSSGVWGVLGWNIIRISFENPIRRGLFEHLIKLYLIDGFSKVIFSVHNKVRALHQILFNISQAQWFLNLTRFILIIYLLLWIFVNPVTWWDRDIRLLAAKHFIWRLQC